MDDQQSEHIPNEEQRPRWLSGPHLREQLAERAADPALQRELDEVVGHTLDEL